jgi:uncharacterized protein (DUF2345 family)
MSTTAEQPATAEQTIRRYLDEHNGERAATVDDLLASLAVDEVDQPRQGGGVMLKLACVLAAIAGIGLITGSVLALTVDTQHVTTAGTIAAISAGGMFAIVWVALIVNWYRKRTMPVVEEEEPSPSKEKPKPSPSKPKPSPSKR